MADTWNHKTVISPDDVLYIDGELVIKGNVTQIETTQIVNRLESNILIINSDGSSYIDPTDNVTKYAKPGLVLKYNHENNIWPNTPGPYGWGHILYHADDVSNKVDAGLGYLRIKTDGYPVNGALQLQKLQTMPPDTEISSANIGILEGNIWSGNSAAAYAMTSAVAISITSDNNGGYTDIVPVAGAFRKAGEIVTLNVNLDQIPNLLPGIYGANTSTTNRIQVDTKGRITDIGYYPIEITFDQVSGGTLSGNAANAVYGLFSNGTGLYYNSSTDTPNGEIGISDTGVGPGTYGQANSLVVFDVNAQGQLTNAANLLINIEASQVNDFESAVEALLGAVTIYDGTSWTAANLAYTPGVFTYTTPTRTEVRNTISAAAPINYDSFNGIIGLDNTIAQDMTFTGLVDLSNATVPGFTITGNLDVLGNLNAVAKQDLYVRDANIVMNVGNAVQDSHLIVDRSSVPGPNSYIRWNSTANEWSHFDGVNEWVLVRDTSDIIEGANLWFEEQRVNNTIDAYLVAGDGIEFRTVIGPGNPNAKGIFADLGANLIFDSNAEITTADNVVTTNVGANYNMAGDYDFVNGKLLVPDGVQNIDRFIFTEIASNEAFIHMNGFNIPITPTVDFGRVDNGDGVLATGALEIYAGTSINPIGNANSNVAIIRGLKAGANTSIYYDTDPLAEGNVIVIDAEGLSQSEVRDSFSIANISGFGNINYDNTTGVISYVGVSTSDIRNQFSASGLLTYNPVTGEFTTSADNYGSWSFITDDGPGQEQDVTSQERVAFQGGTGITVTNAGNVITIVNTNTSADITAVIAGAGLTGGGASGDVTLDTGAGPGIIVNPNNVAIDTAFVTSLAQDNVTLQNVTDNGSTTTNGITVNSLQTTTITAGATGTAGTIEGQWSLTAGSTLTATYADLAEKYESDKKYDPGTVVVIGGDAEVTACHSFMSMCVAGVISENPAFVMNQDLTGGVLVALKGRVPVKVSGQVKKGDLLVTADELGCATGAGTYDVPPTAVVGIALKDSEMGWTEVKV